MAQGVVTSRDGSRIGYAQDGAGPPLVLVHGATADHTRWAPVLASLAQRWTVLAVDRRGRGLSRDERQPYALAREAEDVAAVVESAGSDVFVVAHSFGAICSLHAALICPSIGRLLLYEPPIPTPGHVVVPADTRERVRIADGAGDREQTLTVFFRDVIGASDDEIAAMRLMPVWQARLAAAHTLSREADAIEAHEMPADLERLDIPVRFLVGTQSPPYYRAAAEAITARLPDADIRELAGQGHRAIDLDPEQFLAAVHDFSSRPSGS